ncbi:MAG: DMT family transporter [Betaproteobacteria bacterium]|nr:DMT family transporter [Betaproteobacteria bacterium]
MTLGVSRAAVAVLAIGILAISVSSILVRFAQAEGVPSLAIAFWRVALAALLMLPSWWFHRRKSQSKEAVKSAGVELLAGGLLAGHFGFWIVSLEGLPVAVSAALLATSPVWVGLASAMFLGERSGIKTWIGASVTILSSIVLAAGHHDLRQTPVSSVGPWLALLSAAAFGGYLLCGRGLRHQVDFSDYFFKVTAIAALWLALLAWVVGPQMIGYTHAAWVCLLGLAVLPHLVGHGALNWVARRLPAFPVAAVSLAEPVCAAALAWALLDEAVGGREFWCLAGILAGVALVLRAEARQGPG